MDRKADGERDLRAWLGLCACRDLRRSAMVRLLDAFEHPAAVLAAPVAALTRVAGEAAARSVKAGADFRDVDAALEWARQSSRAIVTLSDPRYPAPLREIPDPPPLLYAEGRIDLLSSRALAVVGSRNATAQGVRVAERFARALSDAGLCIVSGLALGIDTAAHRGGLEGYGSTIAVLGTGIDIAYPARNRDLQARIAERGLLLSAFPLGTAPAGRNFPRRNRIVSGLSLGCLVVEAALPSGSLVTARLAADQGRDVFAVPGSIHSPLARGCHHLIKQGAKLVESVEDVLEEFGLSASCAAASVAPPGAGKSPASPAVRSVLAAIGHDPCEVDAIADRTGLSAEAIAAALTDLELDGVVEALPGGRYQRLG